MSISLLVTDITDAIAGLSIPGVTVVDYDGIVANWQSMPHVMYLNPEGSITFAEPEFVTMLRGANAPMNIRYSLNYRYLDTPLGDLSNLSKQYANLYEKVFDIYNVLAGTDAPYSGKVDMSLGTVTIGARTDPAYNGFNGADFELNISEMHN